MRVGVDATLLVGFIAEFATREGPDYDVHSWIGVALVPLIAVHLVSNWRWVTSTIRRGRSHPDWPLARFNAGFSTATTVCIVSGFPLWLDWSTNDTLIGLHTLTGLLSIALAASHLWRNRQRLTSLLQRRHSTPARAH